MASRPLSPFGTLVTGSTAIVLCCFAQVAVAVTPDNVSSRLQVQVPQRLFKTGGYEHREALFGSPPYGGSIAQTLYYAESDLCDPTVDKRKGYPTREEDETGEMAPWPSPFILMVDRGGCSFVQKARNAQHSGAAGVVIADNLCLCNDVGCRNATETTAACQNSEPIMADDGSGGDIAIPAFLMFKIDADNLKSEVKDNNQFIQLEMSWALPHPDDRVEYELWSVPSEEVSKDFQRNWKEISSKFDHRIYFTPHQYIYDGIRSHCQGLDGRNMCYNLCTNNGRYCATDPDNDLEKGISGADVVKESLRRICIWKHNGESDGIGGKYWDYIAEFLNRCDTPDYFANSDCVKDVYKHSKIDGGVVDRCMHDSGGTDGDNGNTFLDLEIAAQVRRGVVVLPTVFVNTVALRGGLTANTVLHAICAGFLEGTEPEICKICSGCSDVSACVRNGVCSSLNPSAVAHGSVSKRFFGFSLLSVCVIFGAVGYIHWRKTREDMRDQVRGILAEYMPLEGGDDEDGSSPMDFAKKAGSSSLIS